MADYTLTAEIVPKLARGFNTTAKAMLKVAGKTMGVSLAGFIGAGLAAGAGQVTAALSTMLVQATGAIGVIPGIAAAGIAAFATLKVATKGLGDAIKAGLAGDMKAFEKATKNMGESAKAFALEIIKLKPQLADLRKSVSGALFDGLSKSIKPLATIYLPLIKNLMVGIASDMNLAAKATVAFLKTPAAAGPIADTFNSIRATLKEISAGIPGIIRGLIPLFQVSASFLPGLVGGFGDMADRFAAFMEQARASGALQEFISKGLSAVGDLAKMFGYLGSILKSVFVDANTGGAQFFTIMSTALKTVADFLNTAQGMSAVSAIFQGLSTVGKEFGAALGAVLPAVGQALQNIAPVLPALFSGISRFIQAIAPAIPAVGNLAAILANALTPVFITLGPVIEQLASAIAAGLADAVIQLAPYLPPLAIAVGKLLIAFTPLIPVLGVLAGILADKLTAALTFVTPLIEKFSQWAVENSGAMTKLADGFTSAAGSGGLLASIFDSTSAVGKIFGGVMQFLADHIDTIVKLLPLLLPLLIAQKLGFSVSTAASIAHTIALISNATANRALAGAMRATSVSTTANTVSTNANTASQNLGVLARGRAVVSTVAHRVATIASTVATKAAAAGQWLLNAALTANPIGIVIAALVALGVGFVILYKKSETFRNIVQGALHGIAAAGKWMWESVLKPTWEAIKVGFAVWMKYAKFMWETVLKPVFNAIVAAATWLWNVLFGNSIFPAIQAGVQAVFTAIKFYWENILKPIFAAIAAIAKWLWENVLLPTFNLIKAGFQAWMGYAKFMWENVLKPAFSAIGIIVLWLWNNVMKPAWEGIKILFQIAVTAIKFAWENILKPAFNAIGAIIMWLWNTVAKPVFDFIKNHWSGVVLGIKLYWENFLKPTFNAVGAIFMWLWNNVAKPAFDGIKLAFNVAVTLIKGYWENILKPAFNAIGAIFMWLWNNIAKPAFAGIQLAFNIAITAITAVWNNILKPAFNAIGAIFTWLWNNVAKPAFAGIKTAFDLLGAGIKWVWENVIKKAFDAINTAIDLVKRGFGIAVDGIKGFWDKLKGIVSEPVKFVVNTVYNDKIRTMWNWLVSKVGLGDLQLPAHTFASGGKLPGYSTKDNMLATSPYGPVALAGGEYIVNAKQTRANLGLLEAINAGRGYANGGVVASFESGGLFGWIGSIVDKAKNAVRGALSGIVGEMVTPLRALINSTPGGNSGIAQIMKKMPNMALDKIVEFVKKDDAANSGGGTWNGTIAPGAIGEMQKFALAQRGKVYGWATQGPNTYDCSGLVSNLWAIATGNAKYRRYFSTADMGVGKFGMQNGPGQFTIYLGEGHTAANVGGLHAEAYHGNGTPLAIGRIGTPLSYYHTKMHLPGLAAGGMIPNNKEDRWKQFMLTGWPEPPKTFDSGGWLMPGALAFNAGGQPEAVLSAVQSKNFVKWGEVTEDVWKQLMSMGWRGDSAEDNEEILYKPGYQFTRNVIRWGDISERLWNALMASGWKGWSGDTMEAIYRPGYNPGEAGHRPLSPTAPSIPVLSRTPAPTPAPTPVPKPAPTTSAATTANPMKIEVSLYLSKDSKRLLAREIFEVSSQGRRI